MRCQNRSSEYSVIFADVECNFMVRYLLMLACILLFSSVRGQARLDQNMVQLATQYYNMREYEKAAPLLKEIYDISNNRYYFRLYLMSLTELRQFSKAEEEIMKEIRRVKDGQSELLVHWGYILKQQEKVQEATAKFEEAIRTTPPNRANIVNTGITFTQWREFEWAEKLYMHGRKVVPGEGFHSELASVYSQLRNYSKMLEELLSLVRLDENHLPRVQSNLTSAMYLDIQSELKEEFRSVILRRIQSEPDVLAYNRLFIWFLMQESQFAAALRQSIALDRRTGMEDQQIIMLAQAALNSQSYQDASAAFEYIMNKGRNHPAWMSAFIYKLRADYQYHIQQEPDNMEKGRQLAANFRQGLEMVGISSPTLPLVREYAHLLAFYLDDTATAIELLEQAIGIQGLNPAEAGEMKTELADVYLYADDPWEAILLYSQVIDANRTNTLGDEVKLKKARLGYYMGNFSWAKAQLDVLKASTSKLTANDAMELSLFIAENSSQDSTESALTYFARADLLFFRNKNKEAGALLDSITILFPFHNIVDDVLYRKAKILLAGNNPELAAELLEQIAKEFPFGLLADDALYLLADTYNFRLNNQQKAAETYRKILFQYPGSIYVSPAREKFRALNINIPDTETRDEHNLDQREKDFFRGVIP